VCGFAFCILTLVSSVQNRDKLNDHFDKKHSGVKQKVNTEKIACLFSDCPAVLTMHSIVQHLKRAHDVHKIDELTGEPIVDQKQAKPYVCTCGKSFSFAVQLAKHQQNAKEPSEHLSDPRSRESANSKIAKPIRKEHIHKLSEYLQSGHESMAIIDFDRDPHKRVKYVSFSMTSSATGYLLSDSMLDAPGRFPHEAHPSLQLIPTSSFQHYLYDVEKHEDNAAVDSTYLARPVLDPHQLVPPSDPFLDTNV